MAEANYAFVVSGNVTNIAVFDDPSTELLNHFKNGFSLDEIVPTGDDMKAAMRAKDAARLSELGTSCPDHFLRTKIKPLYVDWNPQAEDVAALKAKGHDTSFVEPDASSGGGAGGAGGPAKPGMAAKR